MGQEVHLSVHTILQMSLGLGNLLMKVVFSISNNKYVVIFCYMFYSGGGSRATTPTVKGKTSPKSFKITKTHTSQAAVTRGITATT